MSDLDLGVPRQAHRSTSTRVGRGCVAVLVALVVVLAAVGVAAWRGADLVSGWFEEPADYAGRGSGSVRVEVVSGDSAVDIGDTLAKAGVVASVEAFTTAASGDPRSVGIQPGFYQLREQMSARAALDALVGGDAIVDATVTVPEGMTVQEALAQITRAADLRLPQLRSAARDTARLQLPAYAGGDVEGYLFPATYPIQPRATAAEVLGAMVARFREEAIDLSLRERAQRAGITPGRAVVVASLIEAEVSRPQDLAKVAAVIYNRLDDGMALQLDSTVSFANHSSGSIYTTPKERRNPSQYNTYQHRGLPPTAINAPGARALDAALDPAKGEWRYFVTVNVETGRTLFARGFQQHQRNVRTFDRYCAESDLC
ncbi:MAG: endolytic transglycosylase MltG [Nocardioidaceae bacterium]|nr:endolytic transglycosylase MltG [Nocardioidaceae bacterium]